MTINPYELKPEEVEYLISRLTNEQREMIALLIQGKSYAEVAKIQCINIGLFRARVLSAIDRMGVKNRNQLIAVFALSIHPFHTQYQADETMLDALHVS